MAWARRRTSGTASCKAEGAGGNQRRILAEAVAGDQGRNGTTRAPLRIHGDAGSQHQRLGVDRLGEALGRAFGNHLPEILAEGLGGLVEGLTDHGGSSP
jgi:hypothetical protein